MKYARNHFAARWETDGPGGATLADRCGVCGGPLADLGDELDCLSCRPPDAVREYHRLYARAYRHGGPKPASTLPMREYWREAKQRQYDAAPDRARARRRAWYAAHDGAEVMRQYRRRKRELRHGHLPDSAQNAMQTVQDFA